MRMPFRFPSVASPWARRNRGRTACAVFCALLLACAACTDANRPVAPQDRIDSQAEHAEHLDAMTDSVVTEMTRLDSLFIEHDLEALRPPPFDSLAAAAWTDSVLTALTLDQKIGQLFIVHLPTRDLRQFVNDDALEAIKQYHVGGFLVPRRLAPRRVFNETQRLQRATEVPLLFAADYERGVGQFDDAFTELPSNMALGATRDTVLAAAAGRLTALESRTIGVHLLLAPVVDVNDTPGNAAINIRSYGEDPALVSAMAQAFVREAQADGMLTTLKHFPGHGSTTIDSHDQLGAVASDGAALDSIALRPYREVMGTHAPAAVMSAHLWIQALDTDSIPATFSPHVLHDLLRDSLGFQGLVMTDDVQMGALSNDYDLAERVVRPLQAGADVLLTPEDLGDAVDAIQEALQDGRLSEARLDTSVRRVLWAKAQAGLYRDRYADEATLAYLREKPRGAYLAQTLADEAVTVLKTAPALPFQPGDRVALVQLANAEGSRNVNAAMDFLAEALGAATDIRPGLRPAESQRAEAIAAADTADVAVLTLYQRLLPGLGEASLLPEQERLVMRLLDTDTPVVLVTFGNPYALAAFPEADALIVAYEQAVPTVQAVSQILKGERAPRGKLPVTVGPFAYGSGLRTLGGQPPTAAR